MGAMRRIETLYLGLALLSGSLISCTSHPSSEETAFWTWVITDLLPISPGDAERLVITFAREGYSGPIDLSATDLPAGITVAFDSNHVTGGGATGTVSVAASVAPSAYHFTLHGNGSGAPAVSATVTVTVGTAANYTLSVSSSTVSVASGSSVVDTVNVNRGPGFTDDVFLSAIVPTGISVDFVPSDVAGAMAVATFQAGVGLAAGNYPVTLDGIVSGSADRTMQVTVAVH
jgi:hypothetical protein